MRQAALIIFWVFQLVLATAQGFPRIGVHEGFTRFVFDLPMGTPYQVSPSEDRVVVRFGPLEAPARSEALDDPAVRAYRVERQSDETIAVIELRSGVVYKRFVLPNEDGSFRLVLDFFHPAPAANAPPPEPNPPKLVVVLDPGHGGPDPGATGFVVEKEVALDVALRVKRLLEAQGIEVVLTREHDTDLAPPDVQNLRERKLIDLGKRAGMADLTKTLFISIHVNSAERPAQGIEVYYFGATQDPRLLAKAVQENGGGELGERLTQQAQRRAEQILVDLVAKANQDFSRRLAEMVLEGMLERTQAQNRGVHSAPFYVIRNAQIPAILVELGFANHPTEGHRLAQPTYRARLAEGIATGVLRFLANGAYASRLTPEKPLP